MKYVLEVEGDIAPDETRVYDTYADARAGVDEFTDVGWVKMYKLTEVGHFSAKKGAIK